MRFRTSRTYNGRRVLTVLALLALLPVALSAPALGALGAVTAVWALIAWEALRHSETRSRILTRRPSTRYPGAAYAPNLRIRARA